MDNERLEDYMTKEECGIYLIKEALKTLEEDNQNRLTYNDMRILKEILVSVVDMNSRGAIAFIKGDCNTVISLINKIDNILKEKNYE